MIFQRIKFINSLQGRGQAQLWKMRWWPRVENPGSLIQSPLPRAATSPRIWVSFHFEAEPGFIRPINFSRWSVWTQILSQQILTLFRSRRPGTSLTKLVRSGRKLLRQTKLMSPNEIVLMPPLSNIKTESFHSLFSCISYHRLPHTDSISLVPLQADNAHSNVINPIGTALMPALCFRSFHSNTSLLTS